MSLNKNPNTGEKMIKIGLLSQTAGAEGVGNPIVVGEAIDRLGMYDITLIGVMFLNVADTETLNISFNITQSDTADGDYEVIGEEDLEFTKQSYTLSSTFVGALVDYSVFFSSRLRLHSLKRYIKITATAVFSAEDTDTADIILVGMLRNAVDTRDIEDDGFNKFIPLVDEE